MYKGVFKASILVVPNKREFGIRRFQNGENSFPKGEKGNWLGDTHGCHYIVVFL